MTSVYFIIHSQKTYEREYALPEKEEKVRKAQMHVKFHGKNSS